MAGCGLFHISTPLSVEEIPSGSDRPVIPGFRAKGIGVISEINQWENEVYEWVSDGKYEAGVSNPGYYSNRLTFDFGHGGALDVSMNIQIHRTDSTPELDQTGVFKASTWRLLPNRKRHKTHK